MKKANIRKWDLPNVAFLKLFEEPCEQVQAIAFTPQVSIIKNRSTEYSPQLQLIFKSGIYKEIYHVRAFDVESLVGNMGGYVGLFLGFAFWQAPEAIQLLINKIQSIK